VTLLTVCPILLRKPRPDRARSDMRALRLSCFGAVRVNSLQLSPVVNQRRSDICWNGDGSRAGAFTHSRSPQFRLRDRQPQLFQGR